MAKFTRKGRTIAAVKKDADIVKKLDGHNQKTFKSINAAKRFSRMLSIKFGHGITINT